MRVDEPEVCLVFLGEVDAASCSRLLDVVEHRMAAGIRRFTLLVSTIGGSVVHGLSAYHFLRGLPIEVTTHNFGSVDSVGAVLYCAGRRRRSVPHARFVLHAPFFEFDDEVLGERQLGERLAKLQVDARNMAAVLADETGRPFEDVLRDLRHRTVLDVPRAREWGLVHEVARELVPDGAEVVGVHTGPPVASAEQVARVLQGLAHWRDEETLIHAEDGAPSVAGSEPRRG